MLRIIKITPDDLITKYDIRIIENIIDKTCIEMLFIDINDPSHSITSKLKVNSRATDITKKTTHRLLFLKH
jgi:hypothetical protein